MEPKVLLVDDESKVLRGLRRFLFEKITVETAEGGEAALETLDREGPFAVVVSDMRMPGMNGVELLGEIKKKHPDTVRIMLTGNADQKTAVDAVNKGSIFRFLNKPCDAETLVAAIQDGIRQHQLITAERELIETTLAGSIKVLMDTLAILDPYAFGRATKLRQWAQKCAKYLDLTPSWKVAMAAELSLLGCVTLPPELQAKIREGAQTTSEENEILRAVPEVARKLIGNIPRMQDIADIVYLSSRGFDGSGFPENGPAGTNIPVESRLLHVLRDIIEVTGGDDPTPETFDHADLALSRYDPEIFSAVRTCLTGAKAPSGKPVAPTKNVKPQAEAATQIETVSLPLGAVLDGDQLAEDLKFTDGGLVLAKNILLSDTLIARVRHHHKLRKITEPVKVRRTVTVKDEAA